MASKAADEVTLTVTKQRNGPEGLQIKLRSEPIDFGEGQTTRVLSLGTEDGKERHVTKSNSELAFGALVPDMRPGDWQRASGLKGGTFDRARKTLVDNGQVVQSNGRYSPAPNPPPRSPTPPPL